MPRKIPSTVVQDWVAAGQLLIAILMLWSLLQTKKILDYTRTQIESTKQPVIEVSSFEDNKLHLRNDGGAEVQDFKIVAYLAAHYKRPNEEVTRTQMSAVGPRAAVLKQSLPPSGELSIAFDRLTFVGVGTPLESDEAEAFSIVFRFYRAADRRPFHKIVSFLRFGSGDSSSPYLFSPLRHARISPVGPEQACPPEVAENTDRTLHAAFRHRAGRQGL